MQLLAYLLLSAAALASAQTIDPTSVPDATRAAWCLSQQSSCPLLCTQINSGSAAVYENSCDSETLVFSCVCGNNMSPNSTEYSQTVPYFECTETNNRCVAACANGNAACASACRENHPCGASDPKRYNITSTASSTATATPTGTATGSSASPTGDIVQQSINGDNGNGDGQQSSSDSNPNNISGAVGLAVDLGRVYGTVGLLGSVFLGFAVML